MNRIVKYAAALTVSGGLALAMATPSQARHGWNAAAIGFGVGAVAGAAATSAYGGYYGPDYGYGYGPDYGYDYAPGYAYAAPDYGYDAYASVPVTQPAYGYGYANGAHWSREHSTNNFSIDSQR